MVPQPAYAAFGNISNIFNQLNFTQLFSQRAPTPLPDITGDLAGYVPGDFSITETGAAMYRVGLDVPPGTAGVVPTLKLVYSSSQQNSLLGHGWVLDGLSALSRCPTNISQDGFIDPVDYDENDKLCLDGGRLVVSVSGSDYWADDAEYRTENETFSRIRSSVAVVSEPRSFSVQTKNGLTYFYGTTAQSRIVANNGEISSWKIERVEDTLGNYWEVEYASNVATGTTRPEEIRYTGNDTTSPVLNPYNTIKFIYETRPDAQTLSGSGVTQILNERLAKLEMRVDGAIAWEYQLSYISDSGTNQSLLSSITQCSGSNICLTPTEFTWEQTLPGFSEPQLWWDTNGASSTQIDSQWMNSNGLLTALIDVNGDSLPDRTYYRNIDTNESGFWVAYNNGSGFDPVIKLHDYSETHQNRPQWTNSDGSVLSLLIDMNGDGLLDRALHKNFDLNEEGLWVVINNGNGFNAPELWFEDNGDSSTNYPILRGSQGTFNTLLDMDGDNLPDRVGYYNYQTNEDGLWVWRNNGTGFDEGELWENNTVRPRQNQPEWLAIGEHSSPIMQFTDMNGDGRPDRVYHQNYEQNISGLWVKINNGAGFDNPVLWVELTGNQGYSFPRWRGTNGNIFADLIDINSDQLPDRVTYRNQQTNENGTWVQLNTGNSFLEQQKWHFSNQTAQNYPLWRESGGTENAKFIDMNNDGLADRAFHRNDDLSRHGLWIALNNGSNMEDLELWFDHDVNNGPNQPVSNNGTYVKNTLLDINGDGFADRVSRQNQNTGEYGFWVELNLNSQQNIIKITDGTGITTDIDYGSLTDSSLHQMDHDAVFPVQDIAPTSAVVRTYQTDDGAGGKARFHYFYRGLKVDTHGRGFCGFREIEFVDERTGIKTISYYRQDHPFKSMAYKKEIRLDDDTLISKMEDTWAVNNFANNSYFPYVSSSVEKRFELDGTLINRIGSSKTYDAFGNILTNEIDYGDGDPDYTINEYTNDENNWILGRLTNAKRNNIAQRGAAVLPDRQSIFTYNDDTGLLQSEKIVSDDDKLSLIKEYTHDAFGNIITSTTLATDVPERTTTTVYDSRGQFIIETTNALGQSESRENNNEHGQQTSVTGPNFLTTNWQYDDFGRLLKESRADGTKTRTLRFLTETNDSLAPRNSTYFIRTDSSGSAPVIQYMDMHDRVIRQVGFGLDNTPIFTDTSYNALGDVDRSSDPYFEGDTPVWTVNEYDVIGRIIRTTALGDRVSTTEYNGLTTVVTNPLGQEKHQILDTRGRTIQVTDDHGSSIYYTYDSYGNLTQLSDTLGNLTTMEYNELGNRTLLDDPDSGISTSEYNALGQLLSTTDARGLITTYQYDLLGRMIQQNDQSSISTWEYDTANNGIGKIASISYVALGLNDDVIFADNFEEGGSPPLIEVSTHDQHIVYDNLGRPTQTITQIDDRSFTESQTYDDNGRVDQLTYPSGFAVDQVYNGLGYLTSVTDTSSGLTYWEAQEVNARGQLELQQFGNGLSTTQIFDTTTGFQDSIQTLGNGTAQDLSFVFDDIGNLTQRRNEDIDLEENFQYDGLNRLTRSQVVGNSPNFMGYDELGNMISRTDVGIYTYGENGAGPHAITSISGDQPNNYDYDNAGNRISSTDGTVAYSPSGMPVQITKGNTNLSFEYNASGTRYRQIESNSNQITREKLYIGGSYEEEISNGDTRQIHFIRGGSSVVAIRTVTNDIQIATRYLHKDHLGSIETITDENGAVIERLSFDAWGARRDASDWIGEGTIPVSTDRGFTGHEQLDAVNLTHMNGRVYDPVIGRFLSPDPVIQAPDNTQSLNRYSYVLNNPLSYTDPSGFFFSKLFKAIKNFLSGNKVFLIAAVIGIATGVWLSGFLANTVGITSKLAVATLSGAGAGFTGAASSVIAGGGGLSNALRAGLKGAGFGGLSAGVFSTIGGSAYIQSSSPRTLLAHGTAGGVLEVAQGGKFEHGFFSTAVTKLFSPSIAANIDDPVVSTSIAGLVGGTAAELSGGKFANGAATGAFAHLFNQLQEKRIRPHDGAIVSDGPDGRFSLDGEFRRNHDGSPRPHRGVDYGGSIGDNIRAASNGTVVYVCSVSVCNDSGNQISIRHANDTYSRYFHLDTISVSKGGYVSAGDIIGTLGITGNVSYTQKHHLHFEIRQGSMTGTPIDPQKWLNQ